MTNVDFIKVMKPKKKFNFNKLMVMRIKLIAL